MGYLDERFHGTWWWTEEEWKKLMKPKFIPPKEQIKETHAR
jgi:hypothetical protein